MARAKARAKPRRKRDDYVHIPFSQLAQQDKDRVRSVTCAIRTELEVWRIEHGIPKGCDTPFNQLPPFGPSLQDKIDSILPWFIEQMIWANGGDPRREGPLVEYWPRQKSPPRPKW